MWTMVGGLLKGLESRRGKRRAAPYFARANALRDASRWTEAAEAYARGLEHQPRRFTLWIQLGNCLKEAGEFRRAEDAYMKALELAPNHADTYLQLGHLRKVMGDRVRASESYARALALGCQDFHAIYFQANSEMRDKRWRRAAEMYEKLLESHPDRQDLLIPLSQTQKAQAVDALVDALNHGSRDLDTGHELAANAALEQGLRSLLVRIRPDCDKSFLDGPAAPRALNFTRLMLDFARQLDQAPLGSRDKTLNQTRRG